MSKKLKLVEVTSELGAGTRGASLGVGALKTASFNINSTFFSIYQSVEVKNYNEFLFTENICNNKEMFFAVMSVMQWLTRKSQWHLYWSRVFMKC